jgi:type IV pilus assembly protein PilA
MNKGRGFTLIELMIVISIISIMAMSVVPAYHQQLIRAKVGEGLTIAQALQPVIVDFYRQHGRFPASNLEAGIPAPDKLIGNHVESIELVDGALHISFRPLGPGALDSVLSLRPQTVIGSPQSPITWGCGSGETPSGLQRAGEDRTDLTAIQLPMICR